MPLLYQIQKEFPPVVFVVECVDNDAGVEKVGCHLMASFVELPIAFLTELSYPSGRPDPEFRMVFVFPGTRHILQSTDLLKSSELFFGGLGKKLATSALPDQAVDFADQGLRDDDVGSSRAHMVTLNVNRKCDLTSRPQIWDGSSL